ncbi:MAG TPA: mobilization protein, partial [Paludibacter sp.]|nr:mobilization protein [Paludibacter sp.]
AVIKPLAAMYKFQSLGEYRALLSLYNIGLEEVKGGVRGKPYRGLVYSALDKDGNKVGTPLKSSLFGKSVGYDWLENHMGKSGKEIKQPSLRERTRITVSGIVNASRRKSELREKLRAENIDLVLRRNDQGRIYGVTFISHNDRCVFNGSRLGKEFSANAFNDRFGGPQYAPADLQKTLILDDTFRIEKTTVSDIGDVMSDLLAFLSPELAGNSDDNNRPMKKKQKKKRRYGRQDGSSSLIN